MALAPCASELQALTECQQANSDLCSFCFPADETFLDFVVESAEAQFMRTLAFVPPTQEGFCDEANWRVCEYATEAMVRTMNCLVGNRVFFSNLFSDLLSPAPGLLLRI